MLKRNPIGYAKAVVDATTREFVELLETPSASLRAALRDPQSQVRSALAAFFLTLKPDKPFSRADYRRLLQFLQRGLDGKVRAAPPWLAGLRDAIHELLSENRVTAGYLAARHMVQQSEAYGVMTDLDRARVVRRGAKMFATEERYYATKFARDQVADIKRLFFFGIGITTLTLVHKLQRLGGSKEALRDVIDAGGSAEAVAAAFFSRAGFAAQRLGITELARAYNGQAAVALQELSQAKPETYLKRWDSSKDLKLCPACRGLHGAVVGIDSNFSSIGGMGPPLHPHCRCTLTVFPVRRSTDA